ncbi:MAG: hypothetical protein HOL37_07440 [Rhodospirillaceae bacterium]|jgi:hypothetical protein|nr:hypothetical protein [Rhodospirillaceae bacterium]MBT7356405.1 hypothetical protein [Rhodospirillaceae bacterium]
MFEMKKISWWFWLATVGFLTLGLSGHAQGFYLAIALCVFQVGFFLNREKSLMAFPVQVRIGYLALLVVALMPYMGFIYWIQFAGTWAAVLVGYCPLARILMLMPWNRLRPLTLAAVRKIFFSAPVKGSVLQALEPAR